MTEQTVEERLDNIEKGLTAVEAILRVCFPQFFDEVEDNGDKETTSSTGEGSGETGEETPGEEEAGEETA